MWSTIAENVKQAAWDERGAGGIVNIQRQPGANVIDVVDPRQRLLPQLVSGLPSSVRVSVLTDRTTTIRVIFGRRAVRAAAGGRAGGGGDLPLPAQPRRHRHPRGGRPAVLVGAFGAMYLLGFSLKTYR